MNYLNFWRWLFIRLCTSVLSYSLCQRDALTEHYYKVPYNLALLVYVSRTREIEICLSSVAISLNLMHIFLSNISCFFQWIISRTFSFFYFLLLSLTIWGALGIAPGRVFFFFLIFEKKKNNCFFRFRWYGTGKQEMYRIAQKLNLWHWTFNSILYTLILTHGAQTLVRVALRATYYRKSGNAPNDLQLNLNT